MTFRVRLARDAEADLERLGDFLPEPEPFRDGQGMGLPTQAIAAPRSSIAAPTTPPFTCRKKGQSPFLGEPMVPAEPLGQLALYKIEDESNVAALAVRDRLEVDGHCAPAPAIARGGQAKS